MKRILPLLLAFGLMAPAAAMAEPSGSFPAEPPRAGKKIFDAHEKAMAVLHAKYKAAKAALDAAILSEAPAAEVKAAKDAVVKAYGALLDERVVLCGELVKEGITKLPPCPAGHGPVGHGPAGPRPPRGPYHP